MSELKIDALLDVQHAYSGSGLSVRSLEETIYTERQTQNGHIERLNGMRERNVDMQRSLTEEVGKLRDLTEQLNAQRESREQSAWRGFLSKLPFFQERAITRQSVEELLRRQYEQSAMRVKEAAEFADRLDAAKEDLYDEIERLNAKIIEYARNEQSAASHVIQLSEAKAELEARLAVAEPGSLEAREVQAQVDRTARALAEHSAMLKLFDTAEERLARLQENTRLLARTIAHLQNDIAAYVTIASEKLDLVSGQIQAIGAAADATVVMLEMKQSLEAMTESINHTTRFVSETQVYFRENIDEMIADMNLYDEETELMLASNLAVNQVYDELQIADAVSVAMAAQLKGGSKG